MLLLAAVSYSLNYPYWENFSQGKTPLENVYASVPITVVGTDVNAEVLFLKENGTTKQYLFVTDIDSLASDKQIINADYYLFDIKGVFISAFRMTNGLISHHLTPKKKGSYRWVYNLEKMQTSMAWGLGGGFKERLTDILMDDIPSGGGEKPIQLEPVTVYGHRNTYIPPIYFIPNYTVYPSYDREDRYRNKELGIGGRGNSNYRGNSKKGSSDIGADLTKVKMDGGDNIINELKNPCAKALVDKAPTLANDIATLLNKTFGTNKNIDITIYNKPFTDKSLVDSDAYSMLAKDVITDGEHHIDVYVHLNDNVLKTATQEYILATIYHEVLHGFLDVERQVLGEQVFHQKYPSVEEVKLPIGNGQRVKKYKLIQKQDHDKFAPYIESLAQSIMSLPNSKISLKTARAMAKVGIVEGSSLSDEEKLINQGQRNGTDPTGIKCP
ncbi:hypothetical protein [Capnocytophaga genosp. AHN8471]|uniref:hypothetical protein n=1 Tax=Capnocytophaga genosp. AHN8471 TaxID=327574 RepID=UPI001EE424E8|nr:hypothetical protein [Capnocytophaga genosp. AHN8471]